MSEEMSIAAQVEALGRQFASLARDANLEDVRRYVESFESKVRGLPAKIEEVRARGYPYRSFLENKARIFETQWQETAERVWTQVEEESRALRAVLADVESRVAALREQADPGKEAAGGIDAGAGAPKSRLGDAPKPSLSSALQKSSPAPPDKSLQGRPAKTLGDAPGRSPAGPNRSQGRRLAARRVARCAPGSMACRPPSVGPALRPRRRPTRLRRCWRRLRPRLRRPRPRRAACSTRSRATSTRPPG
ncbi:MAG: hypothetical protein M5R40_01140 [Anaerolineae bacterium]|nr:hypothetical protein [Anaerolineae bacterium]